MKSLEPEIEKDLLVDKTDLVNASVGSHNLVFKYQRKAKVKKLELAKLEQTLKLVTRNQFLYYIGKHPDAVCPEVYEKSELKYIMQGDSKILKVEAHITVVKTDLEFLEDVVKLFITRGFSIKNTIESKKLDLGIL